MNQHDTTRVWRPQGREAGVHLYLSGAEGEVGSLMGARVLGLPLTLSIVPVTDWIDPAELSAAAIVVVQVDADTPASVKRFQKLVAATETPVIAAAYEPPLALVRTLLRHGAHDVLPLPLSLTDLETCLVPLGEQVERNEVVPETASSRLVTVIKSRGGAGATALTTQLACRFAGREAAAGRSACLIDFDIQFGDAAFQLGLQPKFSVADLVAAGSRLDRELLRSVVVEHPSGLNVIGSPPELLPLDSLTNDQVIAVTDRALRDYGTVFVDLPASWTHWSMTLAARSHLILLVTELSVAGLRGARRQLDLLAEQNLGEIPVEIVANRVESGLFRTIKPADTEKALGRSASFTVANDPAVIKAAIDRGVLIEEIKRKSAIGRDLDTIDARLIDLFQLER
jgi:pilus assembly protein CpaE